MIWNGAKRAAAVVMTVIFVIACVPLIPIVAMVGLITPDDEDERGHVEW